jgi:hypothetical protein
MKFIVEASFPLEPFNSYVRTGVAGHKIGEVLDSIKPEVAYFTDNGVGRGARLIIDVPDMSHVPHVTEPLMLTFDATVHYRIAISPADLQSAGLDRYAAA